MENINEQYTIIAANWKDDRLNNRITLATSSASWVDNIDYKELASQTYHKPLEFKFKRFNKWEKNMER